MSVKIEIDNSIERPQIVLHSISERYIMNPSEYKYILNNVGKPLPLFGVYGNRVVVDWPACDSIITLYDHNKYNATIYFPSTLPAIGEVT